MPYLFIFLATVSCLLAGSFLFNGATTPLTVDNAKSTRLVMFLLTGFLFINAAALLTAAYLLHWNEFIH